MPEPDPPRGPRATLFGPVAAEYDAGRPGYPSGVYDALERAGGPLSQRTVVELGAGTGLATDALIGRGAAVIAVDVSEEMLTLARARVPGLCACVADGNALALSTAVADFVCCAQSWHWLDPTVAIPEAVRVLRAGGVWAGWWSHPRADGEAWFDGYLDLLETSCAPYDRRQRDIDWSAALIASGCFGPAPRETVRWRRVVELAAWMQDEASKSYVATLPGDDRNALLGEIEQRLRAQFPTGTLEIPYETWVWVLRLA